MSLRCFKIVFVWFLTLLVFSLFSPCFLFVKPYTLLYCPLIICPDLLGGPCRAPQILLLLSIMYAFVSACVLWLVGAGCSLVDWRCLIVIAN